VVVVGVLLQRAVGLGTMPQRVVAVAVLQSEEGYFFDGKMGMLYSNGLSK
jgi:hypothetical protein